jgi:hypothetical protein
MDEEFLFENEAERKQHTSIIQSLVKEVGFPEKTITSVYTRVLDDYRKDAKIKIFLPILVGKKVKSLLLEVRSGNPLILKPYDSGLKIFQERKEFLIPLGLRILSDGLDKP